MARPILRLYDGTTNTSPQLASCVIELQTLLRSKGYRVPTSGQFDTITENATKLFQQSRGLTPSGIADVNTWSALLQQVPAKLPVSFPTTYAIDDKWLRQEAAEAEKYKTLIAYLAQQINIPMALIAGVGSRESRWGLALVPQGPTGRGDKGNGCGLLQVDVRYHPEHVNSGDYQDPVKHLTYATKFLRSSVDFFTKKTGVSGVTALQAGIAGYNCGPGNVLKAWQAGYDLDFYTAGRDYSRNTFSRAGWFQLNGWNQDSAALAIS